MDINLAQVMQKMSLEEDKPVDLTEDDDVNTVIRSARSLIGRLLNPECQNMARMLKTMPRIWKIYERVKGISLSKESFQFIFEQETDLQTVMKHGFWTFDDWGMVMDRWQEFPPPKFLQTSLIWIRIHNIPVNYFSLKTMDAIADAVGHVKTIEYDPDKPHLLEYVRVLVIVDLQNPLRDTKSVNLPKGLSAMVDIEYERVRKKCFQCLRLSYEKQKCPLLKSARNRGGQSSERRPEEVVPIVHRQHCKNVVETIMPMLAPTVPPGFRAPSNIVAFEVFEQMQLYMNYTDPEERRIREFRMKQALADLERNPSAQRSYLRLENPPNVSTALNTDKGDVYYQRDSSQNERVAMNESVGLMDHLVTDKEFQMVGSQTQISPKLAPLKLRKGEESSEPVKRGVDQHNLNVIQGIVDEGSGDFNPVPHNKSFAIGYGETSSSKSKAGSTRKRQSTWTRKQNSQSAKRQSERMDNTCNE